MDGSKTIEHSTLLIVQMVLTRQGAPVSHTPMESKGTQTVFPVASALTARRASLQERHAHRLWQYSLLIMKVLVVVPVRISRTIAILFKVFIQQTVVECK